jgi:hypothetical protein
MVPAADDVDGAAHADAIGDDDGFGGGDGDDVETVDGVMVIPVVTDPACNEFGGKDTALLAAQR